VAEIKPGKALAGEKISRVVVRFESESKSFLLAQVIGLTSAK